ncbi:MAG: poly-beta-1,6-N-acetyl-D-glucosamine biosynthesis protein PgaD [Sporomusaceae bacterium]|nr:poly-beta-1,6-N-acetyl-D-glucosamine biosynthesis protein PgaD [Sporomusaceae bacterium]
MPIINEPKLQSKKQRGTDNVIITIALAVFSFFLLALTLLLWGAAGNYVYSYLFTPDAVQATVNMLSRLAIFGLVVFIVMLLWSKYNLSVFGNLKRRNAATKPSLESAAILYNIESGQVAMAQSIKSATLDLVDEQIVICSYEGTCFKAKDPACVEKGK